MFVLLATKILSPTTRHFLEELVPEQNGLQILFLLSVITLASLLHLACNEHRLQRSKTILREKELLELLLCDPDERAPAGRS